MTYNPLIVKDERGKKNDDDYCIELFTKDCLEKSKNDMCPVCLENIDNNRICFPFNCYHVICYSCFIKMCSTHRNFDERTKKMRCPLCRKKVNVHWKNAMNVKKRNINNLEIVVPCHYY